VYNGILRQRVYQKYMVFVTLLTCSIPSVSSTRPPGLSGVLSIQVTPVSSLISQIHGVTFVVHRVIIMLSDLLMHGRH
jgi:hypothetical protein